jgi:NADH dehydrogenase FAD-containing subunit
LKRARVQITLIDRTNHHLFQPLLYQVATSVLAPGQIASPIRGILRNQKNVTVILGEVTGVDKDQKRVFVNTTDRESVPVAYDYLILATGVRHSYFGHDEFEQFAPGLKSLADAVAVRNKILQAFEQAEAEEDPGRHRELLTFVLVGAGPTGVEMAAAIAVLVRNTLRREFRRIDPASARMVLLDMANRVLGTFAEDLSAAARRRLESLGVEVRLGHGADTIDENSVTLAGERIEFLATSSLRLSVFVQWVWTYLTGPNLFLKRVLRCFRWIGQGATGRKYISNEPTRRRGASHREILRPPLEITKAKGFAGQTQIY